MMDDIKDDDEVMDPDEVATADLATIESHEVVELESGPAANQTHYDSPSNRIPMGAAGAAVARARIEEELGPLFSSEEANDFRARWDSVQAGFVDEPRRAVEDADSLIAATMGRLTEVFATERQKLEQQWDRGDNVSTEDLRVALRRYRSFFSRLLRV